MGRACVGSSEEECTEGVSILRACLTDMEAEITQARPIQTAGPSRADSPSRSNVRTTTLQPTTVMIQAVKPMATIRP